jgi:hypothetical protein
VTGSESAELREAGKRDVVREWVRAERGYRSLVKLLGRLI